MISCVRTFSMKSNSLKNSRARPKSSKLIRSSETSKPTISSPSQTTSVTSWCTTKESLILTLSKPIPTDINPDTRPVLSAVGPHTSRATEAGRKRNAQHLEKSYLRGCSQHRQKHVQLVVQRQTSPGNSASSSETSRSTRHRASLSSLPAIL